MLLWKKLPKLFSKVDSFLCPWPSRCWSCVLPMQGVWVWSLVGELRSHFPCDAATCLTEWGGSLLHILTNFCSCALLITGIWGAVLASYDDFISSCPNHSWCWTTFHVLNKHRMSSWMKFLFNLLSIVKLAALKKTNLFTYLYTYLFNFFEHAAWQKESQFPDQGLNLCPLQWKLGVPTTGPPRKP